MRWCGRREYKQGSWKTKPIGRAATSVALLHENQRGERDQDTGADRKLARKHRICFPDLSFIGHRGWLMQRRCENSQTKARAEVFVTDAAPTTALPWQPGSPGRSRMKKENAASRLHWHRECLYPVCRRRGLTGGQGSTSLFGQVQV